MSQTVGDLKAEADQLLQQGIRHIKSHQFNEGIRLYQQALAIYQKLGDYESQAEVLALLGYISSFQENYPVAINYLERALKLAREIPNRYLEGNILFNLGGAYIFQKDITRGKEYLQQSLDIAREINDRDLLKVHEQIWQSLTGTVPDSNISSTQSRQHQTLSQNLNSSRLVEAGSLNDQGIELGNAGQFEQAQHFFEKALTIYREIDNQQMESRVLGNIGLLYFSQGYFDQAIDYYNKSLLIARKAQDYQWEAAILTHLGTVNFERGNYAQAIDYQMQSLSIAQKLGDKELEARIQDQLGSIYLNLGEYFKAVEYQLSSLVIIQDLKNAPDLNTRIEARRYEAGYLGNLANTFKNLGEYVKAEEYAQQSLQIAREINNPVIESKALGTLSNISIGKGNYDVAKEYAQQKLTITLRINDRQGQFEALNSLGNSYFFLKDYSTAIKYFQESLNLSQEIGDIYKKGWTLTKLGDAFLKYGNFEESEKFLRLGMEAREALRGKVGSNDAYKVSIFDLQVDTYQLLQQALVAQNKTDEALEIAERGRARALVELAAQKLAFNSNDDYSISNFIDIASSELLTQTINPQKSEADQLLQQGIAKVQISQFQSALELFKKALTIYQIIHCRQCEGFAMLIIGETYYNISHYSKAIEYYQQSLKIAQEINNPQMAALAQKALQESQKLQNTPRLTEANQLRKQCAEQGKLGQFETALNLCQRALTLYQELNFPAGEGTTLLNLGTAYYFLGKYAEALDSFRQALPIIREFEDHENEANALEGLANVYLVTGDYAQAIENYKQYSNIAQKINDYPKQAYALGNLGVAYLYLGDYPKATDYFAQELKIAETIDDPEAKASALCNLGNVYVVAKKYNESIDFIQQCLAIQGQLRNRQAEGTALGSLGIAYREKGDYTKAIYYLKQAIAQAQEINDQRGEGLALGNLGLVYNYLQDKTKAIDYFRQSLEIAREIGNLSGQGASLNSLGATFLQVGNLAEAEKNLSAGIKTWESLRNKLGDNDAYKVSIFEQQTLTYLLLQKVLIAQNQPNKALEISERGRARAFVELLSRRFSPNQTEVSPITAPKLEEIKQIAKTQNATLVEYSIIVEQLPGNQDTSESELYIWVIQPTGEVTFRRSNLKPLWQTQKLSLKQLVTSSRQSIGVRGRSSIEVVPLNSSEIENQLKQLHKILIDPIADLLPSDPNAHVIFMPQGELFLVPFPALQDANGKYLIEKHTILTAPAIQVLDLTQKQRVKVQQANPKGLVVVGNPTMPKVTIKIGEPPEQLNPLPAAENEAITIAKLLNTKALTGNQATKKAILSQLPQARIIHLATHGLLDDFKGLGVPGAIALAPSGNDNGLLTADEILNLKLNAELVVLSACDTGRGRITGDGVIGLSRSLITAGVPSIIVSLWSVPDAPTASLMTEFYRNWQEKKLDKAQALRQAMLTIMKDRKYQNPKNWAAFTLIGEAE
ncbi:MAG: tetratricopeptide repeat protein [Microcystis sp.]|uniref:CHAT domain-containing tetratricopeptide repeat protein n=1 Tax=Microcystis sp. TaxID=1127 RepID=UPI00391DFAA9